MGIDGISGTGTHRSPEFSVEQTSEYTGNGVLHLHPLIYPNNIYPDTHPMPPSMEKHAFVSMAENDEAEAKQHEGVKSAKSLISGGIAGISLYSPFIPNNASSIYTTTIQQEWLLKPQSRLWTERKYYSKYDFLSQHMHCLV